MHFHREDKKLKQRHTGPYEVLEISDQTYRLDVKADFPRLHPVFHAALLWKDVVRGPGEELSINKEDKEQRIQPLSEVIMIEEDEELNFVPERILEKRGTKYLIRWK